jgi:hypothetical protein
MVEDIVMKEHYSKRMNAIIEKIVRDMHADMHKIQRNTVMYVLSIVEELNDQGVPVTPKRIIDLMKSREGLEQEYANRRGREDGNDPDPADDPVPPKPPKGSHLKIIK